MTSPLVAVRELHIDFDGDDFRVELGIPRASLGIVFLLRDNGNVVRGNALASALREHGFGTAICNLLTPAERERAAHDRRVPVRTGLLTRRLLAVVDAVGDEAGAAATSAIVSSGAAAAAALHVAALRPLAFDALVCRRPKVGSLRWLQYVRAATLILAVAGDLERIRPMTRIFRQLQCAKHFEIVSGDSPAFDDERSFRVAAALTTAWMRTHVGRAATAVSPPPISSTHAEAAGIAVTAGSRRAPVPLR